jgi:hypothetical protein
VKLKPFLHLFTVTALLFSTQFVQQHAHLLLDKTHHCHMDEHSKLLEDALIERFVLFTHSVVNVPQTEEKQQEHVNFIKLVPKLRYKVVKSLHQKYRYTTYVALPNLMYDATAPPYC